jgi:hypothetical protein
MPGMTLSLFLTAATATVRVIAILLWLYALIRLFNRARVLIAVNILIGPVMSLLYEFRLVSLEGNALLVFFMLQGLSTLCTAVLLLVLRSKFLTSGNKRQVT